jgi:hypothetical protein
MAPIRPVLLQLVLNWAGLNGGKLIELYHRLPRFSLVVLAIILIASFAIIVVVLLIDGVMLRPLSINLRLAKIASN